MILDKFFLGFIRQTTHLLYNITWRNVSSVIIGCWINYIAKTGNTKNRKTHQTEDADGEIWNIVERARCDFVILHTCWRHSLPLASTLSYNVVGLRSFKFSNEYLILL